MEWGFLTPAHLISLAVAVLIVIALYWILKNKSPKVQIWVLFPLACSGLAAIVYNLLRWGEPLAYLPLHLCSLNAIVLPIAVLTRNKTLSNLLLVWCLGALVALVANFEMATTQLFGEAFYFYYFPHIFEFAIPLLLFKLGLVKKDARCIGSTIGITMLIYTLIHFCNKGINAYCASIGKDLQVNYMFSVDATNPLTALFYQIIPYEYWYMYLAIPVVAAYLLIIYAPELMNWYRNRKKSQETVTM